MVDGRRLLLGVAFLVPAMAHAQGDSTRAMLRGGFEEVSAWVTRAAEMVPAERYTYKPIGTVRSFGEMVAHVADGYNWYCGNARGTRVEWSDAVEKGATDKATVTAKLKAAVDGCNAVYRSGQMLPLMQNIGHANLHYGNLVTYLRMMGLTPPSS